MSNSKPWLDVTATKLMGEEVRYDSETYQWMVDEKADLVGIEWNPQDDPAREQTDTADEAGSQLPEGNS